MAVIRDADLAPETVNPYGGAIALGHPVGATGAILTLRVAKHLARTGGRIRRGDYVYRRWAGPRGPVPTLAAVDTFGHDRPVGPLVAGVVRYVLGADSEGTRGG